VTSSSPPSRRSGTDRNVGPHLAAPAAALSLLGFAALPASAATGPWIENPESRVRFVSGWNATPPAGAPVELDLGVEFALSPGWHVYWKNSGDAGFAPKLDLSETPAIQAAEILFPAPRRFELPGGLVSFGYEGAVIYPISGRVEPPPGALSIAGQLDYLVCAEECVPYRVALRLDLPARAPEGGGVDTGDADRLARARAAVPVPAATVPEAPRIDATIEKGEYPYSTLAVTASGGSLKLASPDLFFESHDDFALGRPEFSLGNDGFRFRVPIRPLDETKPVPAATTFAWTITGLEGPGGPLALAGSSEVPLPTASPSRRVWWVVGVGAAISLLLALRSRSSSTSKRPVPKEAS
jgi:suppressor for copper-sensitivity B